MQGFPQIEALGLDLPEFDAAVRADPVGFLSLQPLEEFRTRGGELQPGELLNVYPPFIPQQFRDGVTYRAVPALQQRRWLADLARQIRKLPDGAYVQLTPLC